MDGCVYRTADGQCEKYSDPARNTMSWCVGDDPCEGRTPSNADRIRQMSDEELAEFMIGVAQRGGIPLGGKPIRWIDWLKAPAEKETDNG